MTLPGKRKARINKKKHNEKDFYTFDRHFDHAGNICR